MASRGSTSIDDVTSRRPAAEADPEVRVPLDVVRRLPDLLREHQVGFDRTGSLHGAGLFEADGTRVVVREDVGRHNAVDKAVGAVLLSSVSRPGGRRGVPPVLVLSGATEARALAESGVRPDAVYSGLAELVRNWSDGRP